MVPEGWKKAHLGSLMTFKNGLNTEKEQYGDGYKFVNVMDVFRSNTITEDKIIGRVKVSEKELNDYKLEFGDILFNRTSETFDEIATAAVYMDNAIVTFGGFVIRGRPNHSILSAEFSTQAFLAGSYRAQVVKLGQGAVRANIGQKELSKVGILLPPLLEQEKIAKILSTWDQVITITEQLLEKSLQQKKGLMQQLLHGKRRLVGFTADWMQVSFGNVFRERSETGWGCLPLLSITSAEGVVNREETGRKDTSNADKSKYLRICPGDIGCNTMRMWQGVSGLSELEGLVSPAYTVLTPQSGIDPLFAAYLFKLPALVHVFYRHSQGLVSDTWNLKYSNFAKIKWSIPDVEEQKAIAAVLANADREIEIMQLQVAGLKQEKKALMQQLLTGKRRVIVDAKEAM